jgi:hypothetical protein
MQTPEPDSIIGDALSFPFRHFGIMAFCAALACIPPVVWALLPPLPYVGVLGLIVQGFIVGYLLLFLYGVMQSATKGESGTPEWPELSDGQEMFGRVLHVLTPLFVSIFPLIVFWGYVVVSTEWQGLKSINPSRLWITAALAAAGFAYLPIAMLIFSFYGEAAVLNLVGAVRSIARMPGDYAGVLLLLLGLGAANGAMGWLLTRLPGAVSVPLAALAGFFLLAVAMRAIGLLYHRNRERLEWE